MELTEKEVIDMIVKRDNESCNSCFYGQYPPTCGKTYGEICDNGWCGFYERLVNE